MSHSASALLRTAYDEAGHAVAKHLLGLAVRRVTIVPNHRKGTGGECFGRAALSARHGPEWSSFHDRHQWQMERDVIALLAGNEAVHIRFRRNNYFGASSDYRNARELLGYYVPKLDHEEVRTIIWHDGKKRRQKVWIRTKEFELSFRALRRSHERYGLGGLDAEDRTDFLPS